MKTETKFILIIGVLTLFFVIAVSFLLSGKILGTKVTLDNADLNLLLSKTDHSKGNSNAPVKIVEFADFQCPACAAVFPTVKKVIEQNSQTVFFVFRHFPLNSHNNARSAAQAAEAAGLQGKFWEMHDLLYIKQKEWSASRDNKKVFTGYAQLIGLDFQKFQEDFENVEDAIESDYADGNKLGVDATPTFFINGQKYSGVISQEQFNEIINSSK